MELPVFSWLVMALVFATVLGIYFLLKIFDKVVLKAIVGNALEPLFTRTINKILIFYPLIGSFIVLAVFIFVNLPVHGPLVALLLLLGFPFIRIYLLGQLLLLNGDFPVLATLDCPALNVKGTIVQKGLLGLTLRSELGLHRLSYMQLIQNPFTIIAVQQQSCYQNLSLKLENNSPKELQALEDAILMAPYIDWREKPQLLSWDPVSKQQEVRVLLRADEFLEEFKLLLDEKGYLAA